MIKLRDITKADKDKIRNWRNLPEVSKYLYTDQYITPEAHEEWFNYVTCDPSRCYWIINCDDEDVGIVYLYDIDYTNKRCFWAFYIASPNVRGKGVGSFVEYSVLKHVFDHLEMNKLCAEVLKFNQPVTNMHKGFGFKIEGEFRKHIQKSGKFEDIVCVAMLKEDWEAKKPEIEAKLRQKHLIP